MNRDEDTEEPQELAHGAEKVATGAARRKVGANWSALAIVSGSVVPLSSAHVRATTQPRMQLLLSLVAPLAAAAIAPFARLFAKAAGRAPALPNEGPRQAAA